MMFILNPVLSFSGEDNQESIIINENEMQTYLQTFHDVIENYIASLEKEGIKVNREVVEKELNNLLQYRGPLELNNKELNKYIDANKAQIDEILNNINNMAKDTEQLGGGGILGGLGGGSGGLLGGGLGGLLGGNASNGSDEVVNSGGPNQVDSLFNTLGRLFGGVYEGLLFGGPLGAGLSVAIGLALDVGISISVILGVAVVAGVILAIITGIGALPVSVIVGVLVGAIIGALLFAVVAGVIFGGGTAFLVVALTFILLPIINIILAVAVGLSVAVIVGILGGIVGLIVGGVLGGIFGLIAVPVAGVLGGLIGGAGSGALFGGVLTLGGQIIFIPLILFLGAIGFVLGLIGGPIIGGAAGFVSGGSGMTLFSSTVKTIESYGDDYVYNIDNIVKTTLAEAKRVLGPKSYNKIKSIEIIVDTADFTTAEGINRATEEILGLLPSLAK